MKLIATSLLFNTKRYLFCIIYIFHLYRTTHRAFIKTINSRKPLYNWKFDYLYRLMRNPSRNNTQTQAIANQSPDPYGPSYPQSAAQYILYRIGITIFAIIMIMVGKSNLPDDAVKCIEDVIIDWLQPVTMFYVQNETLGLTLMTFMQVFVDAEIIAMALVWYFKGTSFRYPIVLSVLGVSKMLLNILFQVKPIDSSFTDTLFPSLVFAQNFKNTYFFSGVTTFLLFNLLELKQMKYRSLMWIQAGILVFCVFLLLTMRQNFFMDVATALVFGHFVFVFVSERSKSIDGLILSWIDRQSRTKENQ